MKIKVTELPYEELESIKPYPHKKVQKQNIFLKKLVEVITAGDLKKANFKCEYENMDKLGKKEPCLILMNHSSFMDLKIAFKVFKDRRFNIVCTDDGFVGKEGLIRGLGCIPTKKFISDPVLVKDMVYATRKLNSSILMYPEATYSFDGRSAVLPKSLAKCIKLLKIPVVIVITNGAYLLDPLYNNLQLRKVDVSTKVSYALSKEDIEKKSVDEIEAIVQSYFTFNNFKYQIDHNIKIDEPFRADCLNRILYLCPHCHKEGFMIGKGTTIKCNSCNNEYELTTTGELKNLSGDTLFTSITDWYDYEKKVLEEQINDGSYHLDVNVEIYALKDMKAIYHIGNGKLSHSVDGFELIGCDGKLNYHQSNKVSYSLYSDYYWYELGDLICIGDNTVRYYCIIKDKVDVASKTRLAVEYLFNRSK